MFETLLSTLAVLGLTCSVLGETPLVQANLLKNGGFEDGEDPSGLMYAASWRPRNLRHFMIVDDRVARSGRCSFKLSPTRKPGIIEFYRQSFPVKEGHRYRLSYWCRSNRLDIDKRSDFTFGTIKLHDAQSEQIASGWLDGMQVMKGTVDWTRLEKEFVAPADATEAELSLGIYLSTGTLWYDDVSVVWVSPPTPGLKRGNADDNLVVNGSFEEGDGGLRVPLGWRPRFLRPWMTLDRSAARTGKFSIKFVSPKKHTGAVECYRQKFPVEGGKTYQITYWCKTEGFESTDSLFNYLHFRNVGGSKIKSAFIGKMRQIFGTKGWTNLTTIVTAPAEARTALLSLGIYQSKGVLWYDDVSVKKK